MLADSGRRIQRMIFCQRRISTGKSVATTFADIAEAYRELASSCDKVIYKDVTLEDQFVQSCVPHAVFALSAFNVTQLWNVFEAHLDAGAPDLAVLKEWITRASAGEWRRAELTRLDQGSTTIQILLNCQSADPRPTTNYRGCWWTVDELLSVDVNQLSRLTLAVFAAKNGNPKTATYCPS
ncbi:uncharacterized protein LOC129600949 [Paramacrobiotus metropolitanus]|uniref:uncharacterized protein LOC129600949 n=1 Tax=Paramacrobiotus metropolitanus TaxID=2943436 RepID=UPI0024457401|nr:uncharacterized protein LOC129600949 [Paramacrobiotus metropolitanus]